MHGVPLRKTFGNKLFLKFKEHHSRNTKNCHSQKEWNGSYFKIRVFGIAEVGCRTLENESLTFDQINALKFRISNTPAILINSEESKLSQCVNVMKTEELRELKIS